MLTMRENFQSGNRERLWGKYCGFLDLSITEFMEMQEQLLMDHIDLVYNSPLANKFMPEKPTSVAEFRRLVPFTTYDDYAPLLGDKKESALAIKPYCWAHTSGRGGSTKWVPITRAAMEHMLNAAIGMSILASANRKGEINIRNGMKVLLNMPPAPYFSGILAPLMIARLGAQAIPPLDKYANASFDERIQAGLRIAFRTGVDFVSSLTAVMVKIGERLSEGSPQMKFNRHMLHPRIMSRILIALIRSKREKRSLLPKDFWRLKGLVCYGMETGIYREQLIKYWGRTPFEVYVATEAGTIAMQSWNKKAMTPLPYSCFLEFISESEWLNNRKDNNHQPRTVLLDEVKPGECYEVVLTSFHGMPFFRYKLGDIVKVVALEDRESGIVLPQLVFQSRTSDIIDIAGFSRLDEKTIWQAIANTGVKYEDWCARKEYEEDKPIVHVYIELRQEIPVEDLEKAINKNLAEIDKNYSDLLNYLGLRGLKVSIIPTGSFQKYYEAKRKAGADLAHLKPPHMNPSDAIMMELINR